MIGEILIALKSENMLPYSTDDKWKNIWDKLQNLPAETLRSSCSKQGIIDWLLRLIPTRSLATNRKLGSSNTSTYSNIPIAYLYPEEMAKNLQQLIIEQFTDLPLREYLLQTFTFVKDRLFRDDIRDPGDPTKTLPPLIYWTINSRGFSLVIPTYAAYAVRILEAKFPGVLTDLLEGLNSNNKKEVLDRIRDRIGHKLYEGLAAQDYSKQGFNTALSMIRKHTRQK
ncbi:MAG: hypothetical protein KatS3mg084_0321 [Candidatus Dojkabacteria bacterium]|nr:MAG: hypothetical protein KatS3mg084_0321 [Candidatus Dojkabacteria bacterium]